jgi:hypothetical protein
MRIGYLNAVVLTFSMLHHQWKMSSLDRRVLMNVTRSLSITRGKEGLARNLNQVQDVVARKEIHSPDSGLVALSIPLSQGF